LTQLRAGVEALLYKAKYSPLHEAVQLIADRLAAADRKNYADAVAAIDDARKQLLEALFEGTVRAEGVRWYDVAPDYERPSVEYDKSTSIDRGIWSHERCEKQENSYRLDTIAVYWNDDWIEYFDSTGEWAGYEARKIRVFRAEIDREFLASETIIPDDPPRNEPEGKIYRTGVAGRPTSKQLALQEMRRRADDGNLCSTLGEQSREMCLWLKEQHPEAPQLTAKALENGLRHEYWRLKRSPSLSP
jgi:hypothetical protein